MDIMKIRNTKSIYKALAIAAMTVFASGCSKYLDVNPDMRTDINTPEKVAQLLVTAYPQYDYLLFTELASDNSTDKGPGVGNQNDIALDSYFWKEVMQTSGNNAPNTYWNAADTAIAASNQALEALEQNDFGERGKQLRGEALLARAYVHHMLVSIFAKAYVVGGDNSSPGIPYVMEPETVVFKDYERGTVASVYENIEKDLVEGIKLINGATFKVTKYHFNPQAANAFAARFYLHKGEYQKVVQYATAIMPDNNFRDNLRPVANRLRTAEFSIAPLEFMSSEGPYNLLLANVYSSFASIAGNGRYGLGNNRRDFLNSKTAAGKEFYQRYGSYGDDKLTVTKYPGLFFVTNPLSNIGYNYTLQCLFSLDEALINRAEAYAQLGQNSLALKDLNDFVYPRIQNYDANAHQVTLDKIAAFFETSDPKEGLIKTVLDFKQRAFFHEGMRWFDINRHQLEIQHNHIDETGLETFEVLKKDDLRRVFQLPESVKNSGLEPNPR